MIGSTVFGAGASLGLDVGLGAVDSLSMLAQVLGAFSELANLETATGAAVVAGAVSAAVSGAATELSSADFHS